MKSGANKTSLTNPMSMIPLSNDDFLDPNHLKAMHSIESILGIKNQQQHLFASHLLPASQFHQHKHNAKKRSSNEHYPDRRLRA
jgi:hypothetical protein